MQDRFNEIPIVAATVIIMFLAITIIGVIFLIRYQRRKYLYQQNLFAIQKEHEQTILKSQLEIQEQTFNAISQEIHDNVGQILSLAKVQLNIAAEQIEDAPQVLSDSKENISRAMNDLRDIAKSLSSDRIEQLDIVQAIQHEAERINKTRAIDCIVEVDGVRQKINNNKKLIVFRIIQESLNNVLKHSGASEVRISIYFNAENIQITIADNGYGFDMEAKKQTGLGLQNIIKRTNLIGGDAKIESALEKGTTINLTVPYV